MALNLPGEIKEKLAVYLEDLERQNLGIKWVNPEGLHLTLHFLGYLDERKIEEVKSMTEGLSGKFGRMDFSLNRLDSFPNLARPRIIFLEAKQAGDQTVFDLQELLGLELIKLKIDIDDRPWRSHLTLGRVKLPDQVLRLQQDLKILPLDFSVSSFELMESELTPAGARYKEVLSCRL